MPKWTVVLEEDSTTTPPILRSRLVRHSEAEVRERGESNIKILECVEFDASQLHFWQWQINPHRWDLELPGLITAAIALTRKFVQNNPEDVRPVTVERSW